jgi:hypothetical protein
MILDMGRKCELLRILEVPLLLKPESRLLIV